MPLHYLLCLLHNNGQVPVDWLTIALSTLLSAQQCTSRSISVYLGGKVFQCGQHIPHTYTSIYVCIKEGSYSHWFEKISDGNFIYETSFFTDPNPNPKPIRIHIPFDSLAAMADFFLYTAGRSVSTTLPGILLWLPRKNLNRLKFGEMKIEIGVDGTEYSTRGSANTFLPYSYPPAYIWNRWFWFSSHFHVRPSSIPPSNWYWYPGTL